MEQNQETVEKAQAKAKLIGHCLCTKLITCPCKLYEERGVCPCSVGFEE